MNKSRSSPFCVVLNLVKESSLIQQSQIAIKLQLQNIDKQIKGEIQGAIKSGQGGHID